MICPDKARLPQPAVKKELVHEIAIDSVTLLDMIRLCYGSVTVPTNAEIKATFKCADFSGVKVTWRLPAERAETERVKGITVIVNGREKVVTTGELSFADIVALAFDKPPFPHDWPSLTVTFSNETGNGILTEGQRIKVLPGIIIDAVSTNQA